MCVFELTYRGSSMAQVAILLSIAASIAVLAIEPAGVQCMCRRRYGC